MCSILFQSEMALNRFKTILIRGGEYNSKVELKALIQRILRMLYPTESEQVGYVPGHSIKLRISQFKTVGRKCKRARGCITCYHREAATKIMSALQGAHGFHVKTRFLADNFVVERASSVCESRYDILKK